MCFYGVDKEHNVMISLFFFFFFFSIGWHIYREWKWKQHHHHDSPLHLAISAICLALFEEASNEKIYFGYVERMFVACSGPSECMWTCSGQAVSNHVVLFASFSLSLSRNFSYGLSIFRLFTRSWSGISMEARGKNLQHEHLLDVASMIECRIWWELDHPWNS